MIAVGLLASILTLGQPTLPPLQWSVFAVHAETVDLRPHGGHPGTIAEIAKVNERVNAMISPEREPTPPTGNGWHIWPVSGWCGDYAATKRHELLQRGWPSSALLIAVVGNGRVAHAILLVRADDRFVALDNLTPDIKPASELTYKPVSIQEPGDPNRWWSITEFPK